MRGFEWIYAWPDLLGRHAIIYFLPLPLSGRPQHPATATAVNEWIATAQGYTKPPQRKDTANCIQNE